MSRPPASCAPQGPLEQRELVSPGHGHHERSMARTWMPADGQGT